MTKPSSLDFFDNEIATMETAKRLCLLNSRLHRSAAIKLARVVLKYGTHTCNGCLSERLEEIESAAPEYVKPKGPDRK